MTSEHLSLPGWSVDISVRDSLFTGQVVLSSVPQVASLKPMGEPEREDFRQHLCVVLT